MLLVTLASVHPSKGCLGMFLLQAITKNTAHPFCIRQYATFQDKYHLYFLFDLMPGGDLMDVLVAEAKVIRQRVPNAAWQVACLAPQVRQESRPFIYMWSECVAAELPPSLCLNKCVDSVLLLSCR